MAARPRGCRSRAALVVALLGGVIPDLDYLPGLLVGDFRAFHHGISHSLAAALMFGVLTFLPVRYVDKTVAFGAAGVATLAYGSHVILDFVSVAEGTRGVPLVWPLSSEQWGLNLHLFARLRFEPDLSIIVSWSNIAAVLRELLILGSIAIVLLRKDPFRRGLIAPRP